LEWTLTDLAIVHEMRSSPLDYAVEKGEVIAEEND
jgi:hypothetical protein